ncbi:unnamed protein product [Rotaria sp. Silwood1]|nr:unnamed protein product [Rotaria sp. Silwood1]CAF1664284.1 unnamed protein product [Rotaria sp. Silwood1]
MKLSFCQNKKNIYERLYNATYRSLSSLLPPLCSQVLFNDSNIQSQYTSPKGLSDRVIPIGTFPSAILALEYLYGAVCPIRNLPTRENAIQSFDLVHPRTDEERQAKINTICNVTQRFCTGTLQQYSSFNDCQQFLRTQIPYGSYDRADQGNVICRFVHTYFVPLLPSIHCPHVGPTGGGACTDKTIDFYYNQTNFLACAHKQ